MSEAKDKQKDDNETEFYEGIAKAANFVNQRQHDSIAPGGLNTTVEEYTEDDKNGSD
jgi:hypothetical protein